MREKIQCVWLPLSALSLRRQGVPQALRPQQCEVKGKIRAKYHIYKTAPRLGIRDLPNNRTRRAGVLSSHLFLRGVLPVSKHER
jgi:hypothetical protein